ncbi:MAG: thermonuclease family protein [Candidatus Coatesbacteria bacterium]|nr:MAG: thermonuclease family protein [Candidatus Coatesbacteria bacterium]
MRWLLVAVFLFAALGLISSRLDLNRLWGADYEVLDGDTIWMKDRGKIRYIGIDTAEYGELYYDEATGYNEALLARGDIVLEFDVETRDKYGRLLAYVFIEEDEGKRVFVNEEMVRAGLATTLDIPPNRKYRDRLADAEEKAQEEGLGIWAE